jgi:hypothetical protein
MQIEHIRHLACWPGCSYAAVHTKEKVRGGFPRSWPCIRVRSDLPWAGGALDLLLFVLSVSYLCMYVSQRGAQLMWCLLMYVFTYI